MLSKVTQSLAGRVALLKLLPFSIAELGAFGKNYSVDDYLLNGFYPRVYADNLNPTKAYRNYYETYVERDIRQILQVKDVSLFQKIYEIMRWAGRTTF